MGLIRDMHKEYVQQITQEFLDWLEVKGITLVYTHNDCRVEEYEQVSALCADFANNRHKE